MGDKRSLILLGWWVFVFLCLHVFTARIVGGGCGCVFGLGIKRFSAAVCGGGKRAHCRVHVQHRVSVRCPCGGGCLRSQPEGGCPFGCGLCVVGCL